VDIEDIHREADDIYTEGRGVIDSGYSVSHGKLATPRILVQTQYPHCKIFPYII